MINKVSSISFKGFYSKKNERYSDSQNRCIDNIKKELGDLINSKNFQVEAGDFDTVELYHLEGLHEGIGVEDSYCRNVSKIGTFDEKHPFKKDDLKKWEKEERAKTLTLAIPAMVLLLGAIGLMVKACTNRVKTALNQPTLTEKVIPAMKDTVNNAKDLTKMFIK